VLLTYMRPGDMNTPIRRDACAAAALVGEPIRGFVEAAQLTAELGARGFRVLEDEGAEAWALRYWVEAPVSRTWEHLIRACKLSPDAPLGAPGPERVGLG
jgi:hypothetical protein